MISLITRYILFIQFVFNSFTTFSISVKTYQVRRINESTYLVTSFPELENDNHKRYSDNNIPNKIVTLNDDKKFTEEYETTMSTVTVGDKREKAKSKSLSPELIKKARENYFRTYYATMKKSNYNLTMIPDRVNNFINLVEISSENNNISSMKFKQNLVTARKLATILINVAQTQTDLKTKDKFLEEVKRRRRTTHGKPKRKRYLRNLSWRHLHRKHPKSLTVPPSHWFT
uniref:Uncharacterized protein n=1 Tax=Heliothis virescens TaxID=7102 RepID=A0A2A4JNB9_HELVI